MIHGHRRPLYRINKTMSAAENCRVGTTFDALQYPMIEIEQLLFRNPQICEESSENLVYPIKVFFKF